MLEQPFDARQRRLQETEATPGESWKTVSLVTAMRQMLLREPTEFEDPDVRRQVFLKAAEVLTARGIDAESLTRYGMLPEVIVSLAGRIMAYHFGFIDDSSDDVARVQEWSRVLGLDPPERTGNDPKEFDRAQILRYLEGLLNGVGLIATWVMECGFEDLVDLKPPAEIPGARGAPVALPTELLDEYRWLVDRFSSTFLSDSTFAVMRLGLPRPGGWPGFLRGWAVRVEPGGIWWR